MKKLAILLMSVFAVVGLTTAKDTGTTEQEVTTTTTTSVSTDIVAIATDNEDFSTLVSALGTAGLVGALQAEGPFTVFAPVNSAFAQLDQDALQALLQEDARDDIIAVLTYHVVAGNITADQITDGMTVETLQGQLLTFTLANGEVMVNNAKVVSADIMASNGVIHVIDTVLLPEVEAEQETIKEVVTTTVKPSEMLRERFMQAFEIMDDNGSKKIRLSDDAKKVRKGLVPVTRQMAVDFLFKNGLTRYETEQDFGTDRAIIREESTRFFSQFAKTVLGMTPDTTKECSFTDSKEFDSTLVDFIKESCQMGLFQGSQGRFMAKQPLTNGQALTVLIRLVGGKMRDENIPGKHRASEYKTIAQRLGLTMGLDADLDAYLDRQVSRGDVAQMLEAASFVTAIQQELGASDVAEISISADGTFAATR